MTVQTVIIGISVVTASVNTSVGAVSVVSIVGVSAISVPVNVRVDFVGGQYTETPHS
jgi:hypothetical protein